LDAFADADAAGAAFATAAVVLMARLATNKIDFN
jgi:hypothetical protein